jgi:hypothetical protein
MKDQDLAGADQPLREWVKPELEVIPMSEAMAGPVFTGSNTDQPFGYS